MGGRHTTWYEVWVAALRISMWIKMIQQGKVDPGKVSESWVTRASGCPFGGDAGL